MLTQDSGDLGLFSSLAGGAVIENFTLEVSTDTLKPDGIKMKTLTHFGGVAGNMNANQTPITLRNITVTGTLKYDEPVNDNTCIITGGLIGEFYQGFLNVENCVSNMNIDVNFGTKGQNHAINNVAGGLIGKINCGNGTMKNSYSTGNVTVRIDSNKPIHAGGLVGIVSKSISGTLDFIIENCYTSGTVTATNSSSSSVADAGGLVGCFGSASGTLTIKNSAALNAEVSQQSSALRAARIVNDAKSATAVLTLSGNIANSDMTLTGGGTPANDATDSNGADIALTDTSGIITVLNTLPAGGMQNIWEWDNGNRRPKLK